MTIKFVDLFCGIGGFRIGMERAGFQCVFSSEKDIETKKTYEYNFDEKINGDIKKIKAKDIPSHDILCAGFPCQPFSISGKKKGFEDTRGTLFFEIMRIVKEKKPKVLLLENVKYLKYHNKGKTFKKIINAIEELDYNVSYEVLNANVFGVPQNRERVIIAATKGTTFDFDKLNKQEEVRICDILEEDNNLQYLDKKEYTLLEKNKIKKQSKSGLIFVGYLNKNIRQKGVDSNKLHLSRTHRQPNRIYSSEGTCPTLSSKETSGRYYILHKGKVRKLTIKECFKVMGFPKKYKKISSKTNLYKQIGNSICPNMVEEIAKKIKPLFE